MVREVATLQNDFDTWNLLLVLGNFAIPLVQLLQSDWLRYSPSIPW